MRFEARWQEETCREMYMFFCLNSANSSVHGFSLQHNPTIAISLGFQRPSFTCRKYSGEWVKLSLITNHVATWKAIIRKTKPEKLHWYWNTWNLSAKGQHSLFHFLWAFWKTLRLRFAVQTLDQAGQSTLLPPKSFWSLHAIKLLLWSVNKLL